MVLVRHTVIHNYSILSQHRFALFSTHAAADLYGQKYGINNYHTIQIGKNSTTRLVKNL